MCEMDEGECNFPTGASGHILVHLPMHTQHALTLRVASISLAILLNGCSGSKPNDTLAADSLSTDTTALTDVGPIGTNPVDLGDYKPGADAQKPTPWDDSLKKYFEPDQVVTVKNAVAEYNDVKSAADFARYYLKTSGSILNLVGERIRVSDPDVYSGDDSPKRHWAWFEQYYPAIYLSVDCGECSYDPKLSIDKLKKKASQTQGNEDDLFVDVMQLAESDSYQLLGCDFCAADVLGDGRYIGILHALEKATPAQALFGSKMNDYRARTLYVETGNYVNSKAMVLAELDKMLAVKILTAEEQKNLKASRDKLASGEYKAQFNCGTEECTWDVN
jgi:hypothetical protein